MDFVSQEFVSGRMAEALAERLRASGKFRQQMKRLREVSHAFVRKSGKKQGNWKLYDKLENEWIQYSSLYGEEAYLLGVEDGMQIATERQIRMKKSVLSVRDMTHLIYMYDAIKKLNTVLLGAWEIDGRSDGVMGTLDRVLDIIEDGVCSEIKLFGEDESFEYLYKILDDQEITPEERAKRLADCKSVKI